MSINALIHDQYPSKVQVSVEEATAEGCDPGQNCSPLYIVSNNPERKRGGGQLIKWLHVIQLLQHYQGLVSLSVRVFLYMLHNEY